MGNNVKIMGADQSVSNNNGTNWKDTKQVSAFRCRLFNLSCYNISAVAQFIWIWDLAAGTGASAAPLLVRKILATTHDDWRLPEGALYFNGLYIAVSTAAPTVITSTPTASGNDTVILKADLRIL